MRIIIFEPHPDDLLFGPGPILLDWINEGHEIHIITITDGRACYRGNKDAYAPEIAKMTEDDVAKMRLNEAKEVIKFLGLPSENLHLLKFPDTEANKYIQKAVEKVKPLLTNVNRIVLPSNNNRHPDHQATYDIVISTVKELKLKDAEFFVYFIPAYGKFKNDSKDRQIEIPINDDKKKKLFKWLEIYQSQKKSKFTWKMYNRFIKVLKSMTYGIFSYEDIGKYYNF
ncbi:MAG: PIG-L deacetylase family protein [Promethearchaeia archaeon]